MLLGEKIKKLRLERDLTQEEVGNYIGTSKQTLYKYETGIITNVPLDKIDLLSRLFNVSPAYLMGWDDSDANDGIPLIGTIAAGTPILAEQNIEQYIRPNTLFQSDFCLRVKGDSMIEAGIDSGDIVFIKQQPTLENGEIGAVIVDDEATLKRFYNESGTIVLQPANSSYKPLIYTNGNVRVLGKLVATLKINND